VACNSRERSAPNMRLKLTRASALRRESLLGGMRAQLKRYPLGARWKAAD
jgi:hypothetical protein